MLRFCSAINAFCCCCFHIGISETEVTTVITSHELLPKFKQLLDKCPKVNTVIYMEDQLHKTDTTGFKDGVRVLSFSQVVRMGQESKFGEWKSKVEGNKKRLTKFYKF